MLLLALSLALLVQDEPAFARRVLQRHLHKGDMVYDATYRRSLQIAQKTWAVRGTVRRLDDELERFRIDGTVEVLDAEGGRREVLAVLWRKGEAWYFADRTAGSWCRGEGPGLGGDISAALFGLYDLPFSEAPERNAFAPSAWEDGGHSSFAGQRCASILCETRDGAVQRWLIAGQDHLPVSIRSEEELGGAERLVERWNRTSYKARRLPEARIDPDDFRARGWKQVDPQATTNREVFALPGDAELARVVSLAAGTGPFVTRFDEARDRPRILGLFGPP